MQISEIGEFALIKRIEKLVNLKLKSTIKGIGDDAAVLDYSNKQTLVTTDMLVEGVHFDLTYMPLKHLGYKAVVVNLSDIFAMNAAPKHIVVSMAVSNHFSVEAIDELYAGIVLACEIYGVDLIGGDTTSSVSGLTISITAIGEAEKDKIVYRDGAQETDLICVSGDLGAAYMGLQLLEREKEVFKTNPNAQLEFVGYDYLLERQLKPEARADIIRNLNELGIKPTSMIDISDGLSSELLHICHKSDKGCKIFEDTLQIHENTLKLAKEFNIEPTICAMNGGEDYELLFTIPINYYEQIKDSQRFKIIGHISPKAEGLNIIARDGTPIPIMAQGWDAFTD